jgi:hypothetical protein
MSKTKKMIRNFMLFILLIILTFYIILKNQNLSEMLEVFSGVKQQYIIIAILCMCIYMTAEAINIGRTLNTLGEKSNFLKNLKYALIGFFFSSITPAASGGQPMQIYYMYKEGVNVANSTLALLINLSSMQIVTISLAIISVCFNYKYLNTALVCFFILGIILNLSALTILLIGILSKRLSKGLINFVIKLLKLIRLKNVEKIQEKLESELDKYQESAKYIKSNKLVILKTLLTTYIQFIIYYSIPYWIYCSLGLKGFNILQIITMQSVLYATVSGIPSPGAVGVSEGGFIEIFKAVFPTEIISSAMLLNRGVNFYLFVIISGFVVIINTLISKKVNQTKTN